MNIDKLTLARLRSRRVSASIFGKQRKKLEQMINDVPDTEPKCSEIVTLIVSTSDPDYWPDYIRGELLYRVNCEDGIVFVFYIKER